MNTMQIKQKQRENRGFKRIGGYRDRELKWRDMSLLGIGTRGCNKNTIIIA